MKTTYRKTSKPVSNDTPETWEETTVANTLNIFEGGSDVRATTLVVEENEGE